jgi:ubiquinone/menaquinone biosynthesis C-methylase UbiE
MVAAKKSDWAVDLACGTGALAVAFARHVRWIMGLDLTPAMLAVAPRTPHEAKPTTSRCARQRAGHSVPG